MKKIAIIGCGTIAHKHAAAFNECENAELIYGIDIIPEKAKAFAEEYKIPNVGVDYREMLTDLDIDAVSLCIPNNIHCSAALDSMKAGKHVLCEKPIALNLEEATSMRDEAQKQNLKCIIGVVNRFDDNVNAIKDLIADGTLGKVYHVNLNFQSYRSIPGMGRWFTNKKESGGGVLIDWGIHFIDLALYCVGTPTPVSISGAAHSELAKTMKDYAYVKMWAGPPDYDGVYDVEEAAAGFLRTSGPTMSLEGAWARNVNSSNMYIEFLGDKGGVKLEYGAGFTLYTSKDGELFEEAKESEKDKSSMYQNEISSFVDHIISGEKSRADIDNILVSQAILDSFYKSSELGCEVKIVK
jgi:predicted dehydrogenase